MIDRKKKLRLIQFFLLFFGLLIIYLTYYNKEITTEKEAIIVDSNFVEPLINELETKIYEEIKNIS